MTAAQKAAKANFKKAIEYRKKTGVSLKEAFAHVYGKKKVGAAPKKKAAKKSAPKKVAKKSAPKKSAGKKIGLSIVKKAAAKAKRYARNFQDDFYKGYYSDDPAGLAKKRAELKKKRISAAKKKVSEKSILNKIHKVKDEVNQLDELQHKHMSISGMQSVAINNVKYLFEQITKAERQFQILKDRKKKDKKLVGFDAKLFRRYPGYIKSLKKQLSEAKKNIK